MTQKSKVTPWSYSSLTAFETCPRRFYLTRIAKEVQEPQTQAMMAGNEVHKALELDIKGEKPLPEKYKSYAPLVNAVKLTPGKKLVEQKVGVTPDFRATTFFGKDVWMRGIIDVAVVGTKAAVVLDWKTGKPKTDSEQLRLFAGAAFAQYPHIDTVKTGFAWLAYNKMDSKTFTRDDVPGIWRDFSIRVQRMEKAEEKGDFPPNPSGLCREWCPVGRKLCEFCGG